MVKRILLLGLAVAALAVAVPAVVENSGLGEGVAQAQTPPTTDPNDQADPPEAPDQADPPDAPDAPDQGDTPGEDDEGSGDDEDDEDDGDEEQAPAGPAPNSEQSAPASGGESGGSNSVSNGQQASQTPLVRVSSTPVSDTDTGTVPQGGIQAGAGGTATDGSPTELLLGSAALMLVMTAGGLVLRRRVFES
jgi:hypothetical protein